MSKVIVYIASSLDGYVADINGSVNFLNGDGSDSNNMGTYDKFYNTIDSVILGNATYKQIVNELSPDMWPYEDKISYVITSDKNNDTDKIKFYGGDLKILVNDLKSQNKNIWICGGPSIINQLIELNLIDKFIITIIPTILGNGIKLFNEYDNELKLKLVSTTTYNGIVEVEYEKRA